MKQTPTPSMRRCVPIAAEGSSESIVHGLHSLHEAEVLSEIAAGWPASSVVTREEDEIWVSVSRYLVEPERRNVRPKTGNHDYHLYEDLWTLAQLEEIPGKYPFHPFMGSAGSYFHLISKWISD